MRLDTAPVFASNPCNPVRLASGLHRALQLRFTAQCGHAKNPCAIFENGIATKKQATTVLDGFPLAKRGMAARALSAAFASSLFGGLVGAAFLTFFILIARPIVLKFQSPELLMVSVFGLSMVGILAGRIALKGIASAGLGILLASIGEGPFNGELRMTSYDYPYFLDGVKLVIVGLGIFAIPEIIALLRRDRAINQDGQMGVGWLEGIKDWWTNKWLSMRCSLIGVMVGVIPELGGSVVDWIAYGHTVQTTKDKSKFGNSEIRGVIGPESANNAKEGGDLVPTLLFGITGSGSMAIFIGALSLLGTGQLEVGQVMLKNNLDLPTLLSGCWRWETLWVPYAALFSRRKYPS